MSVVTIDAVKKHLNITGFTNDDELAGFIAAAEAVIAHHVGPLEPTEITATLSGSSELVLPVTPVVSLTSITNAAGTALTVGSFALNAGAGLVGYASGARFGSLSYDVVYQAGRATCPPDLVLAVKELTRHLWESQRSPAPRPGFTDDLISSPAAGYLMPYRVQELLAPHIQPSIA